MNSFDLEYEKVEKQIIRKLNTLTCDFGDSKLQSLLYHYNKITDYSKKNKDIAIMNRVNVLFKGLSSSYISSDIINKLKNMLDD